MRGRRRGVEATAKNEVGSRPVSEGSFAGPSAAARAPSRLMSLSRGAADFDTLGAPTLPKDCPKAGSTPPALGTVNGSVCYISASGSLGTLGVQQSYTMTTLFTREGIYHGRQVAKLAYVPPDFLNLAHTWSVGCVPGDSEGTLGTEYYNNLASLSLSYSFFIYSSGVSFFRAPEVGPTRAIQFDTGVSVSASLLGLVMPFNIGLAIQGSSESVGPFFVQPWGDSCISDPTHDNLWEYANSANSRKTPKDPLTQLIRDRLEPLLKSLAATGVGGVGNQVPAGSNADLFADQLSREGTAPDESAVNMSTDGLVTSSLAALGEAGDDATSILRAATAVQQRASNVVPSRLELVALLDKAKTAVYAIDELATLSQQTAEERYVNLELVSVPVISGEQAAFTISAEEVAGLIGRPVADVVNARVLVNAGPDIVDAEFNLPAEGLDLTITPQDGDILVRIDIDLSTAQGAFPADVATWLVRPAMRVITVQAGDPAHALLTGPTELGSGGAASLNVQVVDANGRVVDSEVQVVFTDAAGDMIAEAEGQGGNGMAQYVPEPSTPTIADIQELELTVDGEAVPGIEIQGTGFSMDAEVRLDGRLLSAGVDFEVKSSTRILCLTADPTSDHVYEVLNPAGIVSGTFTLVAH